MATSDSFFSLVFNGISVFGGWLSAVPKAIADAFSWFHSKKIDIPDTEQGKRLKKALQPNSLMDKLAQTWAHASFWTKGAVLVGASLVFGVVGIAFSAPILLSFTSLVLGLGLHGLLVGHHEGRVKQISSMVTLQEQLSGEVKEALILIKGEVVDFIQAQKKEAEETFVEFKKETQELAQAVTGIEEQVTEVVLVNKKLVDAGQRIEQTLNQLERQAVAWNNELKQHQKELGSVVRATNTLSGLVDGVTSSHKRFDATVSQLHDAVAELSKSQEQEGNAADDVLADFNACTQQSEHMLAQSHQILDQMEQVELRFEQRKEKEFKDSDLFISDEVIAAHMEGIQATKKELEQVDIRIKQYTKSVATEKKKQEKLPIQILPVNKEVSNTVTSGDEERLKSAIAKNERLMAERKQREAFLIPRKSGDVTEYDDLIRSVEEDLKTRAEQRKANNARSDVYGRFFSDTRHDESPDEAPKPGLRLR